MKKYLFIGYNEDFEDTTVEIYEAESEKDVELAVEMNFFDCETKEDLDAIEDDERSRYEDFTGDNPYKIVELDSLTIINVKEMLESIRTKPTKGCIKKFEDFE